MTRILRGPSSSAATWVSMANPALAAQYALMPGAASRALSDVIDTSDPPSRSCRPACFITRNDPVRQQSITARNRSASRSTMAP